MKDTLYKILWSTIEDFVGLWEISWELNSLFPANTSKQNRNLAKKILIYFLESELINFYFSKWGSDEINQIEKLEVLKIINEEKFWNPPALNEVCIKVGNTNKGEYFYNNNLLEDKTL